MRKCILPLATGILLLPAISWSQSPSPAFEVASIKLHEFPPGMTGLQIGGPSTLTISGNRMTATGSVSMFVMAAYNLRLHQVSGKPDLGDAGGNPLVYDIQAKADGALTMDQAREMMKSLLTGRFRLKVHHETKDVTVYALTVDKNGPKLKETVAGTEAKSTSGNTRGIWKFAYSNLSIGDLVSRIASNFDQPLVDKTGLRGRYDITLEYRRALSNTAQSGNVETEPSIFTALQQLGLKVTRGKEPIRDYCYRQRAKTIGELTGAQQPTIGPA